MGTEVQTLPERVERLPAHTPAPAPVRMGERGLVLTSLDDLWRFATAVAKSGLAPKGMDKPETVLVAIQLGMELGLAPMAALQNIGVINGKPGIYGDAALALVRGSGLCESYTQRWEGQGDKRKAVVVSKRVGSEPLTHEFSVEDAKRAGLWGKQGPWSQYPDRMLLFRARGFNLRDNFGDVLKGLHTSEELQDYASAPPLTPPAPGRHSLRNGAHPPEPTAEQARAEERARELAAEVGQRLDAAESLRELEEVALFIKEQEAELGDYAQPARLRCGEMIHERRPREPGADD